MTMFPSLAWFETAKVRANADSAFRKLGTAEARFGVKLGDAIVEVQMDAFEIGTVAERSADELRELAFYLEMNAGQWREYLDGLRGIGRKRSISDVDLEVAGGVVRGADARAKMNLPRYVCSVDRFFELGAME